MVAPAVRRRRMARAAAERAAAEEEAKASKAVAPETKEAPIAEEVKVVKPNPVVEEVKAVEPKPKKIAAPKKHGARRAKKVSTTKKK